MNLILATDSYKVSHFKQEPPGAEFKYFYLTARAGRFSETVWHGLHPILRRLEQGITYDDIAQAESLLGDHMGVFNQTGWTRLMHKHQGRLPVRIKALPEGTVAPHHTAFATIENTDPEFPWLPGYLESLIMQTWYPSTVATQSRAIKQLILAYLDATGDPSQIGFKLHDFGVRGCSSMESAAIGGVAHLTSFLGTDNLPALVHAQRYYGVDGAAGFSIPAAEHSTITSWGRARETDAYRNMIEKFGNALYAIVIDSYDPINAASNIFGDELRGSIIEANGTCVLRPDSGDPVQVISQLLRILGNRFGYSINAKGYAMLHPKVRLIQGDGVNYDTIDHILARMKLEGWSADNIAFGMGGALLQGVSRDTQGFAMKCSDITINGEHHDVYKAPATDPGKRSAAGRFAVIDTPSGLVTCPEESYEPIANVLQTVFEDGDIKRTYTLDKIRHNVARSL